MMKPIIRLAIYGLLCLLLAGAAHVYFSGVRNDRRYQQIIETFLRTQEAASDTILRDSSFAYQLLTTNIGQRHANVEAANTGLQQTIEKLSQKPFHFLLYENERLIFWSNSRVPIFRPVTGDNIATGIENSFENIKNSHYEVRQKHYLYHDSAVLKLVVLIPLRIEYGPMESYYLPNTLPASNDWTGGAWLPQSLYFRSDSIAPNCYPIHRQTREVLCYMDTANVYSDKAQAAATAICALFGLFLLGRAGNRAAKVLIDTDKQPQAYWGTFLFAIVVILCMTLVRWADSNNLFGAFDFSMDNFSSNTYVLRSLRDLIIFSVIIFWVAFFFQRSVQMDWLVNAPFWARAVVVFGLYALLVTFLLLLIGILSDLVSNTSIAYIFQNLFDHTPGDFVALLCLSMILYALFLLTHRLIFFVKQMHLKNHALVVILDLVFATVLFRGTVSVLPVWLSVVFWFITLVYIYSFHFYFNRKQPNSLIWTAFFLALFTALPTLFIVLFANDQEIATRNDYVHQLSQRADVGAFKHIEELCDTLTQNHFIAGFKLNMALDTYRIARNIERAFANDPYLSKHYSLRFFGTDERNVAVLRERNSANYSRKWHQEPLQSSKNGGNVSKYQVSTDTSGCCQTNYLASLNIPVNGSATKSLRLYLDLAHDTKQQSYVESELLGKERFQYKNLRLMARYAYAIYYQGQCVEQNKENVFPKAQARLADTVAIGMVKEEWLAHQHQTAMTIYRPDADTYIYITRIEDGQNIGNSMLAFLFFLLLLILGALTLIDYRYRFLPPILRVFSQSSASLSNRFILPLLVFNVAVLSIFIAFAYQFFLSNMRHSDEVAAEAHARNLLTMIRKDTLRLDSLNTFSEAQRATLQQTVSEQSQLHQTAIHVYDANGMLVSTSEQDLDKKELLMQYMPPDALFALQHTEKRTYSLTQRIGELHYLTQFYAIDNSAGQTIGYLELPFYENDRKYQRNVSELLGNVLFISIFVLLAACIYANSMARYFIKPITEVGKMLEQLTLGKKNVKVAARRDELNLFVQAFNNKVDEIEASLLKIQENEREAIWRDIARMVAHEITNPLTPMQLLVQHLELIRQRYPEKLPHYVERTNKSLLEQISSLERLAREFSQFVRLPQTQNAHIVINEVIENLETLFAHQFALNGMTFSVVLPKVAYTVYADKNLLKKALDNLVLNAQQAIPSDRAGNVTVLLYHREGSVIVEIRDNGSGIPEDIRDKIFNFNFTTKTYGSGLGLGFTKSIVNAVNGKLTFQTETNVGTSFFIELELFGARALETPKILNPA